MRSFLRSQYSMPGKARNIRASASSPTLCRCPGPGSGGSHRWGGDGGGARPGQTLGAGWACRPHAHGLHQWQVRAQGTGTPAGACVTGSGGAQGAARFQGAVGCGGGHTLWTTTNSRVLLRPAEEGRDAAAAAAAAAAAEGVIGLSRLPPVMAAKLVTPAGRRK